MAINSKLVRHNRLFLLAFALSLGLQAAGAQAGRGSRMELSFIQRLSWNEDGNALRYEVIIEKEEDGVYSELQREFTPRPWIDVTLPPGNYRYRIIPYNYLNRPGEGSQWVYREVLPALRPELAFISPGTLYLDESTEYALTVSGNYIEADAEIELRHPGGVSIVPYAIYFSDDGTYASLFFTEDQLEPGIYEVYIRNQSGLETSGGVITIAYPEEENKHVFSPTRLNTVGVSFGTTFATPLYIVTLRGTLAPWDYSFLDIGLDIGLGSINNIVDYFSMYPFVRYALFLPFASTGKQAKNGWYMGAGGGFMLARYTFPEGDVSANFFIADFVTGFIFFNFFDISYYLRIGFMQAPEETAYSGINHKISTGLIYRF